LLTRNFPIEDSLKKARRGNGTHHLYFYKYESEELKTKDNISGLFKKPFICTKTIASVKK